MTVFTVREKKDISVSNRATYSCTYTYMMRLHISATGFVVELQRCWGQEGSTLSCFARCFLKQDPHSANCSFADCPCHLNLNPHPCGAPQKLSPMTSSLTLINIDEQSQ